MKKIFSFAVIIISIALSGCASREGIRLPSGSGPSKEDVDSFNKRNATSAPSLSSVPESKDSVKTDMIPIGGGPRIVIVGNVMSLNTFDDITLNTRYDNYVKKVSAASGQPAFTREWYLQRSAGDVAVKISGIPGVYSRFYKAEVPKDIVGKIGFASAFGTFMAGTSGDLVAAESVTSFGIWVTRLLCSEKASDFSICEEKYQRGLYQSVDGREVDEKFKIKDVGATIDTATFEKKGDSK